MEGKAPVFIKIDEYRQVMDVLAQTKEKLQQARSLLDKLTEIKNQEDTELANWSKQLEDVEQKVNDVDKALIEPEV